MHSIFNIKELEHIYLRILFYSIFFDTFRNDNHSSLYLVTKHYLGHCLSHFISNVYQSPVIHNHWVVGVRPGTNNWGYNIFKVQ